MYTGHVESDFELQNCRCWQGMWTFKKVDIERKANISQCNLSWVKKQEGVVTITSYKLTLGEYCNE